MRFSPFLLFGGQKRVLSDYRRKKTVADNLSRVAVFGLPVLIALLVFFGGQTARDIDSLIAGTALLAGTLLAAFGQLASWRAKLTEHARKYPNADPVARDSMDETVTHVLAAAYTSGLATILLAISSNFEATVENGIQVSHGVFLALGLGFASHAGLSFLIAIPRLYYAYASMNRVREELTRAR